jgi:hypothetical protein
MDLTGFSVVLWVGGFFAVNEGFELFQEFLRHRWIWLHFLDNSVGGTELWTSISWEKTFLCANRWVLLRLRGGFFLRPEDGDFSILKILLRLRILSSSFAWIGYFWFRTVVSGVWCQGIFLFLMIHFFLSGSRFELRILKLLWRLRFGAR